MIKIMYLTTDQTELSVAMEYAKRIGISIYPKTLPESGEEYVRMCMEIAYDRDVDVMMEAFKEFTAKSLKREQKPSIRKMLAAFKEQAAQRNAGREKVRNKDRGQEL